MNLLPLIASANTVNKNLGSSFIALHGLRHTALDVIEQTMAGEHIFPDKTPSVKLGLADSSELTAKEIEVLRFVCEGLEYSEIAERMHISQRTVKFHVSNILSKTGYANKTRLAIAVTNKNFIIPSSPEKNPPSL